MTVASFVIACVALFFSGAALGWQVLSWFMSGGRVKVEVRVGAGGGPGILSAPAADATPEWWRQAREQGYSIPLVIAWVHNSGRLPIYVKSWGIEMGRIRYTPIGHSEGPGLPYKVEPGADVHWSTSAQTVRALLGSQRPAGANDSGRAFVYLGTGKKVTSKNVITTRDVP